MRIKDAFRDCMKFSIDFQRFVMVAHSLGDSPNSRFEFIDDIRRILHGGFRHPDYCGSASCFFCHFDICPFLILPVLYFPHKRFIPIAISLAALVVSIIALTLQS